MHVLFVVVGGRCQEAVLGQVVCLAAADQPACQARPLALPLALALAACLLPLACPNLDHIGLVLYIYIARARVCSYKPPP